MGRAGTVAPFSLTEPRSTITSLDGPSLRSSGLRFYGRLAFRLPTPADSVPADSNDPMVASRLRYLLLQVRNPDDPMRDQEVRCFARVLNTPIESIQTHDLLSGPPTQPLLAKCDLVLLGGSGDYSVAAGGAWLEPVLEAMRELYEAGKPTFASCWGFQAMARALGGTVVTDLTRAELGTIPLELTEEGRSDAVFGVLPLKFPAHAGHQDIVDALPPNAVRLAEGPRTLNQAFTFPGKPIYCTQFHPELTRQTFLERLDQYPTYVERILGCSLEAFAKTVQETPEANQLLGRFVEVVFS